MAGRIPNDFIQDLLARTDIVELIDARVPLKKAGKNYQACCPFHGEKTPSFTVSPDKQFYHCFGCGAHGTAIGFLMEFEGLSFPEAVEDLAKERGMEVPREGGGPRRQAKREGPDPYELMARIEQFYRAQLRTPAGQAAVDYLKQRGLSGDIAARFGIGFAPPGWDNLQRQFGREAAQGKQLIELGMLIAKESGRPYDRFRERIMFPIRNRRGKCIGFGGRVLGDGTPKYLNSPETPLFHKGRELYGLYEARQSQRHLERLLVVEGYMDVVALAQHGIHYAVATLGTSATAEHVQTLFRHVPEVVLCFDGDRAGRDAAWRAMNNALPHLEDGRQLKFMFMPDGEDPDSLVRAQGQAGFEALLAKAQPLSEYLFERLTADLDLASADSRARLGKDALPLIAQLPDGVFRHMLRERLAQLLNIQESALDRLLQNHAPSPIKQEETRARKSRPAPGQPLTPVARAISLLLQKPERVKLLPALTLLGDLKIAGLAELLSLCEQARGREQMTTAQFLELWRDHRWQQRLEQLAMIEHAGDETAQDEEFLDIFERFFTSYVQQRVSQLLAREKTGGLSREERLELARLLQEK